MKSPERTTSGVPLWPALREALLTVLGRVGGFQRTGADVGHRHVPPKAAMMGPPSFANSALLQRVLRKVEAFTWPPDSGLPDEVLLVPENRSLDTTIDSLKQRVACGKHVRVVGQGASLWLEAAPIAGVSGTEVGALQVDSLAEETAELRTAFRRAVSELFGEALESEVVRVLYPAFCARYGQRYLYELPVKRRLTEVFAGIPVTTYGQVEQTARTATPAAVYLPVVWGFCAAEVARLAASYPSIREYFSRMTMEPGEPTASTLVALIPDWARINSHIIDAVANPILDKGGELGILLIGSLKRGRRSEQSMRSEGDDLWSGLGALHLEKGRAWMGQAVVPTKIVTLGKAITRAFLTAGRASLRVSTLQGQLGKLGAQAMSVSEIGRLIGVDALRVALARAATDELVGARDLSKSTVVFASSSSPPLGAVDVELQRKGATTVHMFHGGLGDDWIGAAEHPSGIHVAWTENDRRCLAPLRTGVRVGGMPRRIPYKARALLPSSILVMTSYLHRDYQGVRALGPFEDEMVEFMRLLRLSPVTGRSKISWRPHPASLETQLKPRVDSLRTLDISISRNRTLADDVADADIIVSNMSTVIAEVLLGGLPVFAHVVPLHWGAPASDFLHDRRAFFRARAGLGLVEDYFGRCSKGEVDHEPEAFAKRQLWGETGEPGPIDLTPVASPEGPTMRPVHS